MEKLTIILDFGHGGINPSTGQYVTSGKRSRHAVDGSVFYEGHEMRIIGREWVNILQNLGHNVLCVVEPDDWRDVPLSERARIINELHLLHPNAVVISLHSNADSDTSPRKGQARGHEVWTSPGITPSDHLAKFWIDEFKKSSFGNIPIRKDLSDGFPDKEAAFTILQRTTPPAILIELGFHTNDEDVRMMRSWDFRLKTALAADRAVKQFAQWRQTA